jgi:hypothetical protein
LDFTTMLNRRSTVTGLTSGGISLALGTHPVGAAQAFSTAGHPLVGTWFLVSSSANPTEAHDLFILHADGTYIEANADGTVRLGAWEATGPLTGTVTIEAYSRDEAGANLGAIIIRLNLQLDPDGNGYQAEGTIERVAPDGSASGQAGPATGTATRLVVEAPGPPVMSLDELFGGAGSTPEATPAA